MYLPDGQFIANHLEVIHKSLIDAITFATDQLSIDGFICPVNRKEGGYLHSMHTL